MARMVLVLEPDGFECTLGDCPPGFFLSGEELCFKSEYMPDRRGGDAYCDSGEFFQGPEGTDRALVVVKPLKHVWKDAEEM